MVSAVLLLLSGCSAVAERYSGAADLFPSPLRSESCAADDFHALDAWVGVWRVIAIPSGVEAGRAQITSELGGCVLLERWNGLDGRAQPYDGLGVHRYDGTSGRWVQSWFGDQADAQISEGTAADGGVVYEQRVTDAKGEAILRQYITPAAGGRYSNRGARSTDGGASWTTTFDLMYEPAPGC